MHPPGNPKIPGSGRKPGTPNRDKGLVRQIVENSLQKSIPEAVLALLDDLEPMQKAQVLLDLMQYAYPRLKAVELTGAEGESLGATIVILPSNGRELPEPEAQ